MHKCFWEYIRDSCDHAGVWEVDFETAEYFIGESLSIDLLRESLKDHIIEIRGGNKWFIPDFIKFQYGRLRNNNSAHISVLRILEEYDLLEYANGDNRPLLPSDKVSKKMRIDLFDESNGTCAYCDKTLETDGFEIDHIKPTIAGGNSKKENLILCCSECNSFKSDFELSEFIKRRKLNEEFIISKLKALKKGLFSPYLGAKDKDMDKDKDKAKDKDVIKFLFNYWNGLKIITHRNLDKYKPCLNSALEHYSEPEIQGAMKNYSTVLFGKEYYWTHKWGLDEFLSRKGGLDKFLTVNMPFENFRDKSVVLEEDQEEDLIESVNNIPGIKVEESGK